MKEQSKTEFSELLTAIVDDEATERQKTEFKRLAKHDPDIGRQLESLRRQKQLINALPVESAPEGLAEDVTSMLERKLILSDFSDAEPAATGSSHLMLRRLMTTAAMLLLPLGLLSLVVWQIMKPASGGPANYVTTTQVLNRDNRPGTETLMAAGQPFPFDGILTFRTSQQTTVSNYTEKVIFDLGLLTSTVPNRNVDVTTYQVTASPVMIANLLESLNDVWPRCEQVSLSVVKDSEENTIEIPQVRSEQIKALALEDSPERLNIMAIQYARANKDKDTAFARAHNPNPESTPLEQPALTVPILTGRNENPDPAQSSQSNVRLRIHIRRTVQ